MVRFEDLDIETIDVEEGIRHTMEKEPLEELTDSIRQHGVLQPLIVEPGEEGRYNLQIGRRRLEAAKMAGLEKVPTVILDEPLEAQKALAMKLVENIHREDLDEIDEAEAYAALRKMGTKVSEIARLVGKKRPYISHQMRLLKLHPKVMEEVKQNNIQREQALALLRLEPYQQIALAEEVMEKGLTMQVTRDRVRGPLGKELKWRLVPIRIEPAVYDRLVTIAPEGDVSKLLKQAVENLLQGIPQ